MIKNHIIAYYPYSYNIYRTYHGMIREILSEKYFVIDYDDVKKNFFQLNDIDALFLNWVEDKMDEHDRMLILKAAEAGIRIYWVFHNRISHNKCNEKTCKANITFLLENVTDIIILSHSSIKYLYEYIPHLDMDKIHYLPHPNYTGVYGALENSKLVEKIATSQFVFGCTGTLRPDKNIELVIKAFKQFPYRNESKLFIAGKSYNEDYLDTLEKLIGDDENILLFPEHVPDYMMNFYVESADVLILPYDIKTCMNSGVMLLAFTNKRTVIVSDISMTTEFNEALFYRYSYTDDEDHILKLATQMEKAYTDGRKAVRKKGAYLYEEILTNNSMERVKSELYKLLDELAPHNIRPELIQILNGEYRDKDLWRRRYSIADTWLQNMLSGNAFIKHLKENQTKKIAIYGFGKYGKLLYEEMLKHGISVACIIDQNAGKIPEDVLACTLETLQEKLDIVVVTIATDINIIRTRCQILNENCYVFDLGDI